MKSSNATISAIGSAERMQTEIQVEMERVYGTAHYIPKCELSKGFVRLLGQKLLTLKNLEAIREMGFQVRILGTEERML